MLQGWTALHCAAHLNRADIAQRLIAHGSDVSATDEDVSAGKYRLCQ